MEKKLYKTRYWAYEGNSLNGENQTCRDDESDKLLEKLGIESQSDDWAALYNMEMGASYRFGKFNVTCVKARKYDTTQFGSEVEIIHRVENA